jgi:hypothetical protein
MSEITDEYTTVLLRKTETTSEPDADKLIWEHGRRNFELRAQGKLPIVCTATDDSDWAGMGIFDATRGRRAHHPGRPRHGLRSVHLRAAPSPRLPKLAPLIIKLHVSMPLAMHVLQRKPGLRRRERGGPAARQQRGGESRRRPARSPWRHDDAPRVLRGTCRYQRLWARAQLGTSRRRHGILELG